MSCCHQVTLSALDGGEERIVCVCECEVVFGGPLIGGGALDEPERRGCACGGGDGQGEVFDCGGVVAVLEGLLAFGCIGGRHD